MAATDGSIDRFEQEGTLHTQKRFHQVAACDLVRKEERTLIEPRLPSSFVKPSPDQIPGKLLHPSRQPRMRIHQPYIRLLR